MSGITCDNKKSSQTQDGTAPEMAKHVGTAVVKWMTMIRDLAGRQGEANVEWKKSVIAPLHRIKGNQD